MPQPMCGLEATAKGLHGVWLSVIPQRNELAADMVAVSPCILPMELWVRAKTKGPLEGTMKCCGNKICRKRDEENKGEAPVFLPVTIGRDPVKRPNSRLSTDPLTAILYLPGYLLVHPEVCENYVLEKVFTGCLVDMSKTHLKTLQGRMDKFAKTAGKDIFLRTEDFPVLSHVVAAMVVLNELGYIDGGAAGLEYRENIKKAVILEANKRRRILAGTTAEVVNFEPMLKRLLGIVDEVTSVRRLAGFDFTLEAASSTDTDVEPPSEFSVRMFRSVAASKTRDRLGHADVFSTDFRNFQSDDGCIIDLPVADDNPLKNIVPDGYVYEDSFITEDEEAELLKLTEPRLQYGHEGMLRRVAHFGYNFLYPAGGIDLKNPDPEGLQPWIAKLARRIETRFKAVPGTLSQMTANEYNPGQGIAPHFDDFDTIGELLCTISLGAETLLTLTDTVTTTSLQVRLKRRSIGVMTRDVRYKWTHGVPKRMTDPAVTPGEKALARGHRISLTFRNVPPNKDWRLDGEK
eukprot:TRINITY_DN6965_c0_g1_i1.p1 TRINITY_DN6965_c0_g1~~TRINITY_DN6965_c0_g1_i1.p1  ORF type:complete len:537 (+),score=89.71 TRINITY_DN6965_c0_g1_i1:58-1611(+)